MGVSLGGWNEGADIRTIENLPASINPRQTAKTRLNKLVEKLETRLPGFSKKEIKKRIIKAYVSNRSSDTRWMALQKGKLMRFLKV